MNAGPLSFSDTLRQHNLTVGPAAVRTLWVHVTNCCNQSCTHCHAGASPSRTEDMDHATVDACLGALAGLEGCQTLDVTGGAPELCPSFDYLVVEARKLEKRVVVRHNLTVTYDGDPRTGASKTYLPEMFAENRVEVLASLPHYTAAVTDQVRGRGVFGKSIAGLRRLNSLGYGHPGTGLVLDLVCNCDGPVSADQRAKLEAAFRRELGARYGLTFNGFLTVTNMPITRYRSMLERSGRLAEYLDGLAGSFSRAAAANLACRDLISVGADGGLYDCDFNQALGLRVSDGDGPLTVFDVDLEALLGRQIRFGPHCFGCTAGGGSH